MLPLKTATFVNLHKLLDYIGFSDDEADAIYTELGTLVTWGDAPHTLVWRSDVLATILEAMTAYYDDLEADDSLPSRSIPAHVFTMVEITQKFNEAVGEAVYIDLESDI
jgi:hypothetical protein